MFFDNFLVVLSGSYGFGLRVVLDLLSIIAYNLPNYVSHACGRLPKQIVCLLMITDDVQIIICLVIRSNWPRLSHMSFNLWSCESTKNTNALIRVQA